MTTAPGGEQQQHSRTVQARERIQQELTQLYRERKELRPQERQDSTGDRADEAVAREQSDELTRLNDRIDQLTQQLERLEEPVTEGEQLADGTTVTLRFDDDSVETLQAVTVPEQAGSEDTMLTTDSPLGRALAGCRPGDTTEYETPVGMTQVHVIDVRPPEETTGE